jgi:hypothetical protein
MLKLNTYTFFNFQSKRFYLNHIRCIFPIKYLNFRDPSKENMIILYTNKL